MQTILVTGGSGVLGSAFKAIAKNYPGYNFTFWTSRECDLIKGSAKIVCYQFDYIIHTAALSGGVGLAKKHPAKLLRDNVLMDLNVLEAARLSGVQKVIMTLSTGMYWPTEVIPIKEDDIHRFPPHESNYSYAFAKRLIDPMIRSYREEYGLNAIGLVPNGIFGENDYFGAEDSNMLAALISKFFRAMCTGEDVVIWGDGSQLRELTYAKDLARAYMWALENYNEAQILNVGNTQEYSIKDIALLLANFMTIKSDRIIYDLTKPTGPYRKPTDNSRFLGLSGFEYTPFKEALTNTINWYVNEDPRNLRTGSKVR